MRLPESAAFVLFDLHKIPHPDFFIGPPVDQNFLKQHQGKKFVVKANIPVGGKKKAGLVQFAVASNLNRVMADVSAKIKPHSLTDTVLVEKFIDHDKEYFLALKAVREGIEVYFSELGGVDVEQNWEKVDKVLIPTESLSGKDRNLFELDSVVPDKGTREWVSRLIEFFQRQDVTYLEINPFATVAGKPLPLGVVLEVDEAAKFRHPEWPLTESQSKQLSDRERKVAEADAQIKGSVKLVEVKEGGDTALLAAGAGAALFLADAIIENGFKLANYSEFSGNPPSFAVTELTKQVCALPGVKNLVIGSGIANFTPVGPNFEAIIDALKASPQAWNLNIVVRRCGPGEDEGIKMMREFAARENYNIQVFGREIGMTDIVNKLKVKS